MAPPSSRKRTTKAKGDVKETSNVDVSSPVETPIRSWQMIVGLLSIAAILGGVAHRAQLGSSAPHAGELFGKRPVENAEDDAGQLGALGPINHRLLTLLMDFQNLEGDEHLAARRTLSLRTEGELVQLRAEIDPLTTDGKQQLAMVDMVQDALKVDREGQSEGTTAWKTDEDLEEQYGFATFANKGYWDKAYKGKKYGELFDWYGAWDEPAQGGTTLADIMRPLLSKASKILMLGCGNSNMSAVMYDEGYRHIDNVDVVPGVIEQMRNSHAHLPDMTWHAMDASQSLDFPDAVFDIAIEKGLFDALHAGTGTKFKPAFREIRRVLRPGGRLLSVSFHAETAKSRLEESEPSHPMSSANATPPMHCWLAGDLPYSGTTAVVHACDEPTSAD